MSIKQATYLVLYLCLVGAAGAGCTASNSKEGPVVSRSETTGPIDAPGGVIEEKLTMETNKLHQVPEESTATDAPQDADIAGTTWAETEFTEYRIAPGDLLEFQSFDDPSISRQQVVVRYDGFVSLPLIPDINVSGKTREEATLLLTAAYTDVFLDPQLSLAIMDTASKTYSVMGDVMRPAEYPYRRAITILDAINAAGGLRINQRRGDSFVGAQGELSKALIIRMVDGRRRVFDVDIRGLSEDGPHNSTTPILPGDGVYIPEGVNLVYLIGEVGRPDVYALTEGTTLVKLLAVAGGPNFTTGKMRRVVLMREIDKQQTEILLIDIRMTLKTGQDILLRPGDVIYVPQKDLIRLQQFVQRFTGSISPVLSLYTQALNAYYERDRIDLLLQQSNGTDLNSLVSNISQFLPTVPLTTP